MKQTIWIKLSDLPKVFEQKFKKEKMIQLENRILFSSFWKKYSFRALTLALLRSKKEAAYKLRMAFRFQLWLYSKYKSNGSTWVIKYLKASQLALSRSVAGSPMSSLTEVEPGYIFPSLTKSGLPKYIPSRDRRAIAGRSYKVIRFWSTLFSLYRVLQCPNFLKLKTITDPFSGSEEILDKVEQWVTMRSSPLLERYLEQIPVRDRSLASKGMIFSSKSSPSSRVAWTGRILDLEILMRDFPIILQKMMEYARITGNTLFIESISLLGGLLHAPDRWVHLKTPRKSSRLINKKLETASIDSRVGYRMSSKFLKELSGYWQYYLPRLSGKGHIGQLAFKNEPAGKVRVFAMVDSWTQDLLNPLHQLLFSLLKKLPNDGTFDQNKSFQRCIEKAKANQCSFGYDLSAATDRLPLKVQIGIVKALLSQIGISQSVKGSQLWADILTERPYAIRKEESQNDQGDLFDISPDGKSWSDLKYSVGQPMGALSSWAMLALTHHMIVQYCAHRVGAVPIGEWFDGYEVIGDDIQIFNREVAAMYLIVMRGLGVEVNESKSVVSLTGDVVEYAKRISYNGIDVSPISWRMILSQENFSGRVATALWMLRKGVESPRKVLMIACSPTGDQKDMSYLSTSALALLTSISGKRGITLESLLMGLVNEEGKLLPKWRSTVKYTHEGIYVPVSMFIKKIKEFFSHDSMPISLWFSEHWKREEAVESLETYIKDQLNYEMGRLVIKISDRSFLRSHLVSICSVLWPHNEDNIIVLTGIQMWVDKFIWSEIRKKFNDQFRSSANDMVNLQLKGLYQPKYLKMMSLEKLLRLKAELEGIVATLEMGKKFTTLDDSLVHKEPIPNSLRIIKVLLKSLLAKPTKVLPLGASAVALWDQVAFLQDHETIKMSSDSEKSNTPRGGDVSQKYTEVKPNRGMTWEESIREGKQRALKARALRPEPVFPVREDPPFIDESNCRVDNYVPKKEARGPFNPPKKQTRKKNRLDDQIWLWRDLSDPVYSYVRKEPVLTDQPLRVNLETEETRKSIPPKDLSLIPVSDVKDRSVWIYNFVTRRELSELNLIWAYNRRVSRWNLAVKGISYGWRIVKEIGCGLIAIYLVISLPIENSPLNQELGVPDQMWGSLFSWLFVILFLILFLDFKSDSLNIGNRLRNLERLEDRSDQWLIDSWWSELHWLEERYLSWFAPDLYDATGSGRELYENLSNRVLILENGAYHGDLFDPMEAAGLLIRAHELRDVLVASHQFDEIAYFALFLPW